MAYEDIDFETGQGTHSTDEYQEFTTGSGTLTCQWLKVYKETDSILFQKNNQFYKVSGNVDNTTWKPITNNKTTITYDSGSISYTENLRDKKYLEYHRNGDFTVDMHK